MVLTYARARKIRRETVPDTNPPPPHAGKLRRYARRARIIAEALADGRAVRIGKWKS